MPLSGIAIPLWTLAFVGQAGKIEMQLASCERDKIRAVYINSGKRPAMVTGHSFALFRDNKEQSITYEVRPDPDSIRVINPNDPALTVTYKPFTGETPDVFVPHGSAAQGCMFRLTAYWKDFSEAEDSSQSEKTIARTCSCPK